MVVLSVYADLLDLFPLCLIQDLQTCVFCVNPNIAHQQATQFNYCLTYHIIFEHVKEILTV